MGILPGIIGLIQATETVKLILGIGTPLIGRLMLYDALNMKFRELKLRRNPECPICGDQPTIKELIDYQEFCGIPQHAPEPVPVTGDISVVELKQRLDKGDKFQFIDVREPHEWQICRIPGTTLVPLGELPKRLSELDPNSEIVVHCKSGGRSGKAVDLLKQNGFVNARNVVGGILAWADQVDKSVPKY